jgi:carboxyl-terminal processing protease
LKTYIDQFDPDRVYLLESEVKPFLNPSTEEMAKYIEQYKKGNFSIYEKINQLIQTSIARARINRESIEQNANLFASAKEMRALLNEEYLDPDTHLPFSKNQEELKAHLEQQIKHFLKAKMQYYGTTVVMNKKEQVLGMYEKQMRHQENEYLFLDSDLKPVNATEKEHLFTLHILKAIASSLDSHTSFFNEAEAHDMRVHLEKELHGVGIVLQQSVNGIVIAQLMPNSPASKSGLIRINDEVVEVDGKSTKGESFEKIMAMIKGDDGTSVTLTLRRNDSIGKISDNTTKVILKRAPIVMLNDRVDVAYEKFGNGIIGKLTMHSFYQADSEANGDKGISSEKDLRAAIQQLKKIGHLRGLVLDFRENGGGFLSQAIKVAGLFISNGIVVVSKYANGEEQIYRDIDGRREYNGPIIILTSKATASAAEIVAQALQDYGVALIVGDERTYGKGSIQSQTVTDNQSTSFFKVTVGKYYTVSGKTPQIRGVIADIVVPSALNREKLGEEFLEHPLKYDKIDSSFDDKLMDIDTQYKAWFLKYYVPTLQYPVDSWKKMVPVLKKNSEYRIEHNKNFQTFLKKISGNDDPVDNDDGPSPQKNVGSDDLQMGEAVNVVKDMIILQSLWDDHPMGLNSVGSLPLSSLPTPLSQN